ncbi:MAG: peptidyl-prolyl cis-trans isomerase [Bradymonadaceae bacterium]
MNRPVRTAIVVLVAAAAAGCPPTRPAESWRPDQGERSRDRRRAAVVNGETITLGELEGRLEALPAYVRAEYRTVERKREFLKAVAKFEILADRAESRFGRSPPEARWSMKETIAERFLREAVGRRVTMDAIADRAVETYYREHLDRYRRPAQRRAAVIETVSRQRAEYLRAKLTGHQRSKPIERVEAFRTLASRRSVDPGSAKRGGDVGWIAPPDEQPADPALSRAVFALEEKGRVSELFRPAKEENRWAIATYYKKRPASRRPLDEVARDIRTKLYEKRRAETRRQLLERWRERTDVRVDADLADRLEPPESRPPAGPGEIPLVRAQRAGDGSDDSAGP